MNILLVSDNIDYANELKSKLIFLRNNDNTVVVSYNDALSEARLSKADIVLVHEAESLTTLRLIKKLQEFNDLCIILVAETQELILNSADLGIDDYVWASAPNYEFVIRIINNVKRNSLKLLNLRNQKLLEQHKAIDDLTGFYNCPKLVVENAIDNDLLTDGFFMALSPSNESKAKYSIEVLAQAIKKSVRAEDILSIGQGVNVYIFMPNTNFNGAMLVLNKIKENINFEMCAGLADISGKVYDIFEADALRALAEALATNANYVLAQECENKQEEWLNDDVKNYKLFRKMYSKKLEKEISPVLYRLQKSYEEKLFGTEIEQCVTDEQCIFKLKSKTSQSMLRVIYPGFAKIIIDISHDGLDSPENREIQLPLQKVNQKEIGDIIEEFIKEYKTYVCK